LSYFWTLFTKIEIIEDHGSKNINGVIHYTFCRIVEATNDFSNKLREEGYGLIYKVIGSTHLTLPITKYIESMQ
jgi:hypothetical protein